MSWIALLLMACGPAPDTGEPVEKIGPGGRDKAPAAVGHGREDEAQQGRALDVARVGHLGAVRALGVSGLPAADEAAPSSGVHRPGAGFAT